jgi:uncharacterized protein YjbI with pentapeptide repeats
MAKQAQIDLLKRGVPEWNQWRDTNPYIRPDLSNADLRAVRLSGAYLDHVDFRMARLNGAHLPRTDLRAAHLSGASLRGVDLREANLRSADLAGADLSCANLRGADLMNANLGDAVLRETNLTEAYLRATNLSGARLSGTVLGGIDLREVNGLESVHHESPSYLSIETIYRSAGQIPEAFLRGTGIPAPFIASLRSLVTNPMDAATCFMSYSSKDEAFAYRLCADLQQAGIRCWLAPKQMKNEDKIHQDDESIRFADQLLLVLSEHSIASPWVPYEVEVAFEKERRRGGHVLFPLALDDSISHTPQTWMATIRRRKHIGNFTRWQQPEDYLQALERLLQDVKAEP